MCIKDRAKAEGFSEARPLNALVLPGFLILLGLWPLAHVGRLKLFKHNGLVLRDQLASFFVMKIFPLVTDMPMSLADVLCGFSPALRSALLSRQCFLQFLELVFSLPQMS